VSPPRAERAATPGPRASSRPGPRRSGPDPGRRHARPPPCAWPGRHRARTPGQPLPPRRPSTTSRPHPIAGPPWADRGVPAPDRATPPPCPDADVPALDGVTPWPGDGRSPGRTRRLAPGSPPLAQTACAPLPPSSLSTYLSLRAPPLPGLPQTLLPSPPLSAPSASAIALPRDQGAGRRAGAGRLECGA